MLMLSSIKKALKEYVRRLINWRFVAANQAQVVQLANDNAPLYLNPVPPIRCGGTVDRYYHFILDLVLPLYLLKREVSPGAKFLVSEPGAFKKQLLQLFPEDVEVIDAGSQRADSNKIDLIGMNPKCVHLSSNMLEDFRKDICSYLEIDVRESSNKILLIERLPPDEYFFTTAQVKGGGASWRSIVNHEELRSTLASMVKAPFEFHNLQLEKLSFEEQVFYFDRALVVIAQHGAGLTNCLWMRRKGVVVELTHDETANHYRTLSRLRHLDFFRYETDSNHATVNMDDFSNWLLERPGLSTYFQAPKAVSLHH